MLFGDVSQPGHLSAAGVGDQDVEAAAAFGDRGVQRVKGGQVGDSPTTPTTSPSMSETAASTTSLRRPVR